MKQRALKSLTNVAVAGALLCFEEDVLHMAGPAGGNQGALPVVLAASLIRAHEPPSRERSPGCNRA